MSNPNTRSIPTLETDHLLMRVHALKDFSSYVHIFQNPTVLQYISSDPFSEEEIWYRFLRYFSHWQFLGYGYWAIEEKKTGNFIGEAGFSHYKREISPRIDNTPEIGWIITPEAQGKGYANEAIAAILKWGDKSFPKETETICLIQPDNTISIHIAKKYGYKPFKQTKYKGKSVLLLKRPSPLMKK